MSTIMDKVAPRVLRREQREAAVVHPQPSEADGREAHRKDEESAEAKSVPRHALRVWTPAAGTNGTNGASGSQWGLEDPEGP